MSRIAVYCGSSKGARPEYARGGRGMGKALARRGLGLVYGGAYVGIMGEVARAVLAGGGEVIGVIPESLAKEEVAFEDLPDLRIVGSMHERKALISELADGFIALPGGIGTLEEFFEIFAWAQLGFHNKPFGLLNIGGYFDKLIPFLDHLVTEKFMMPEHRSMVLINDDPEALLDQFENYEAPVADKAGWAKSFGDG